MCSRKKIYANTLVAIITVRIAFILKDLRKRYA
jgi:hypothetical protein